MLVKIKLSEGSCAVRTMHFSHTHTLTGPLFFFFILYLSIASGTQSFLRLYVAFVGFFILYHIVVNALALAHYKNLTIYQLPVIILFIFDLIILFLWWIRITWTYIVWLFSSAPRHLCHNQFSYWVLISLVIFELTLTSCTIRE